MSTLYDLVNVFDENDKWLGEFISKEVAEDWLNKFNFDLTKCEISKRRPELKREL
jgi:hypothetical protein